ncbi:MAG: hypothetical protein NT027_20790 [Proteobacteria bacterium]|nr:hypothetical protein [Pseudomonadota bacterium]
MFQGFKQVLIIEPRTDVASLLKDVCKDLGCTESVVYGSIKDCWSYLQTAEKVPDWIITAPDATERYHVYHLLKLMIMKPEFLKCRVSMLVTDDEWGYLPIAFDLGLLAVARRPASLAWLHALLGLI